MLHSGQSTEWSKLRIQSSINSLLKTEEKKNIYSNRNNTDNKRLPFSVSGRQSQPSFKRQQSISLQISPFCKKYTQEESSQAGLNVRAHIHCRPHPLNFTATTLYPPQILSNVLTLTSNGEATGRKQGTSLIPPAITRGSRGVRGSEDKQK